MTKKSSSKISLLSLPLFFLGIGYLIFTGVSENSIYFLNVSEALAMPEDKLHSIRIFGVAEKAFSTEDQESSVKILLRDKDDSSKTMWVVYSGQTPETLQPESEVIAEGSFENDKNRFNATSLMTKCPSKYEKSNRS